MVIHSLCPDFWSPSHQFSVLATLILPLCLGPGTCTLIARSGQYDNHDSNTLFIFIHQI